MDENQGFTLLEVIIATTIGSVILGALLTIWLGLQDTYQTGNAVYDCQATARNLLNRVCLELQPAGLSTLDPVNPANATSLRFQKNTAFTNGAIVWGNPWQLEFVYLADEINNGVDDNGNALVDEGYVLLFEDLPPTGASPGAEDPVWTLAQPVKENGILFTLDGKKLTITVAIERAGAKNRIVTLTLVTGVTLRN